MGKMKNVGLELSLNKNEQRRDTHLGISRRHEVHDVPVWLRCRRRRKRLRTTRRSRGGAARGGGTPCATSRASESAACWRRTLFLHERRNSFQKGSRTGPTTATDIPDCMIAQEAGGPSTRVQPRPPPAPCTSTSACRLHQSRPTRIQSKAWS